MSDLRPWVDLPTPLTEKILERLPLSDYVRFPAVCQQWRSIQADHRRRHAPSAPPMLNLPWIISHCEGEEDVVLCYSPFEDRSYRIPIPNQPGKPWSFFLDANWLLLEDAILNPVSGVVISLPEPLPDDGMQWADFAAVLPPPDQVVLVLMNSEELYLCRQGDHNWTQLILPVKEEEGIVTLTVTFSGKLYCIWSPCNEGREESMADHLMVIDPLQVQPAVTFYPMAEWSKTLLPHGTGLRFRWHPTCLVECGGEVLLVREIGEQSCKMFGYQVLRPDLTKRMWMRVETLGDRLLILHNKYSISLLAADVGLKGNCIYFSKFENLGENQKNSWNVFDLGAGTVTEVAFPNALLAERICDSMLMPSLC